ncbi:MAG: OmpA family protein [Spirochaetales bacterium]|nr:OmpA family protein [Spirochaetales bacterium]
MKRIFCCIFIFSFVSIFSQEKEFKFLYNEGELFQIRSEVFEDVYVNGEKSHYSEIINKISGKIEKVEGDRGFISARFFMTEKILHNGKSYNRLNQEYYTEFWRDSLGRYDIKPVYYMPVVRDVPHFSGSPVSVGGQWVRLAYEYHDFRDFFGIPKPVSFPISVSYEYRGEVSKDGKNLDLIVVHYDIYSRQVDLVGSSGIVPILFSGTVDQEIFWDNNLGRPHSYREKFEITVLLSNGNFIEYVGNARSVYVVNDELNKKELLESLRKEDLDDVDLRETDRGISITLSDIKFKPDSSELEDGEIIKLKKIAEILKKYPNRDLLITGHTALRGTPEGQQSLSEERARVIAEFLIANGVRSSDRVFVQGKGATEPIADNYTEEGLAKNRRVEILILEN